jgi:hypothetical protein
MDMPKPTRHAGGYGPDCPWCGRNIPHINVEWDNVEVLTDPSDDSAILVSARGCCPECGKPVTITETRTDTTLVGQTAPERTERDRQYLRSLETVGG